MSGNPLGLILDGGNYEIRDHLFPFFSSVGGFGGKSCGWGSGDLVTCCLKYFLGLFTDPVDGERLVNCSSDVLCILLAKRTKFKHAWSFCRETV